MKIIPFWRVCRVLANRPRLKILGLLSRRPGLRVSEVARSMKLSQPTASQYLRALESCGLLGARRVGRSVVYEVDRGNGDARLQELIRTLLNRVGEKTSIEETLKLVTAFASAGRIDVFRTLSAGPKSRGDLCVSTGYAPRTLGRHIKKLRSRGFVRRGENRGIYEITNPADDLGRVLADVAKRLVESQNVQTMTTNSLVPVSDGNELGFLD